MHQSPCAVGTAVQYHPTGADCHRSEPHIRRTLVASMDLNLLLKWRRTCHSNYIDVCDELRDSLRLLLAEFVPSPSDLLSLITRTRALIAGELALRYVLRDGRFDPRSLDIYLGNIWFDKFVNAFFDSLALSGFCISSSVVDCTNAWIASRQTDHVFIIKLSNGKFITVHSSASPSACHAIACSPTTLGTTFVTADCFATAYPQLTLNKRAIICPEELAKCPASELDMYARLEAYGFSYEVEPSAWLSVTASTSQDSLMEEIRCPRRAYMCPQQGRYFGDDGSLLDFMDPLRADLTLLKERSIPPYGHMAVWRLPSYVICDNQCDEVDDILFPGMLTAPIMFETNALEDAGLPVLRTSMDDHPLRSPVRPRRSRTRTT